MKEVALNKNLRKTHINTCLCKYLRTMAVYFLEKCVLHLKILAIIYVKSGARQKTCSPCMVAKNSFVHQ